MITKNQINENIGKKGYKMVNVEMDGLNGNKLTPLLQAVSIGDLESLKRLLLLKQNQIDLFEKDEAGGTALHYAAFLANFGVAIKASELILKKAEELSATQRLLASEDILRFTPLTTAAKLNNWKLMEILLEAGSKPNITNSNETIYHILASSQNEKEALRCVQVLSNIKYFEDDEIQFRNYLDIQEKYYSNTALHTAGINGNALIIEELMKNGANPTKTNHIDCNIFHFTVGKAKEEKAYACTNVLMKDDFFEDWKDVRHRLMESTDSCGRCPIHIASRRGYPTVLRLLKGYFHLHEGNTGLTPLHSAAKLGDEEQAGICVNEILSHLGNRKSNFCNAQDGDGCTPLYLAAKERNLVAAKHLLSAVSNEKGASGFDIKNKRGKTPLEKVYEKIPEAVNVLLEESIKNSGYVEYYRTINTVAEIDYGPILGYSTSKANIYKETEELAKICNAKFEKRKSILNDVFIRIFIYEKWQKVKWFFHIFRFLHILWFFINCLFVIWTYRYVCPIPGANNFTWIELRPPPESQDTHVTSNYTLSDCEIPKTLEVFGYLNLFTLFVYLFCQFHETKQKFHYLFRPPKIYKKQNSFVRIVRTIFYYLYLLLRILPTGQVLIAAAIFIAILPTIGIIPFSDFFHYFIAGLVGLGVWFAICLEAMKFPRFSFYKNLLWKSGKTLLVAIAVTAPILFGFASLFSILVPEERAFSSPAQSLVKVITFMIGELDYGELFYGEKESIFLGWAMLFIALFVLIVVVLLVNFLIGLAAEEISDVWDRAIIWDLCTKLEQINALESFLDEQIPMFGRSFLKEHLMLMPPDKDKSHLIQRRVATVRLLNLPKDLRKQFHKLRLPTVNEVQ